jgi:3'(2'), 5'-bisphosphate nucleotidase
VTRFTPSQRSWFGINTMLGHAFPDDPIVGEEDAEEIRDPSATYIRERVVTLSNQTLTRGVDVGENGGNGYDSAWGVGVGMER